MERLYKRPRGVYGSGNFLEIIKETKIGYRTSEGEYVPKNQVSSGDATFGVIYYDETSPVFIEAERKYIQEFETYAKLREKLTTDDFKILDKWYDKLKHEVKTAEIKKKMKVGKENGIH